MLTRDLACTEEFSWLSTDHPMAAKHWLKPRSVASACGSTVHLVAIIDPSESLLVVEAMSFIPDNQRFVIQAVLDEAVRRLGGTGCTATSELKYGKPAEQIILVRG